MNLLISLKLSIPEFLYEKQEIDYLQHKKNSLPPDICREDINSPEEKFWEFSETHEYDRHDNSRKPDHKLQRTHFEWEISVELQEFFIKRNELSQVLSFNQCLSLKILSEASIWTNLLRVYGVNKREKKPV